MATYGIGGLIAGKILPKAVFFCLDIKILEVYCYWSISFD
ncbi:MAG: hypothetical protein ACO3VF_03390 [Tamlana sp.]